MCTARKQEEDQLGGQKPYLNKNLMGDFNNKKSQTRKMFLTALRSKEVKKTMIKNRIL